MWRNGPVSSSSTGSTPRRPVYQASLAARSDTVTATCVMAGMTVGLPMVFSSRMLKVARRRPRKNSGRRRPDHSRRLTAEVPPVTFWVYLLSGGAGRAQRGDLVPGQAGFEEYLFGVLAELWRDVAGASR